jgi:hypothetical protein
LPSFHEPPVRLKARAVLTLSASAVPANARRRQVETERRGEGEKEGRRDGERERWRDGEMGREGDAGRWARIRGSSEAREYMGRIGGMPG